MYPRGRSPEGSGTPEGTMNAGRVTWSVRNERKDMNVTRKSKRSRLCCCKAFKTIHGGLHKGDIGGNCAVVLHCTIFGKSVENWMDIVVLCNKDATSAS